MATGDIQLQIERNNGKTKTFPVVPVPGYFIKFNEKTKRPEAAPFIVPKHTHSPGDIAGDIEIEAIDGGTP